MSQTFNHDNIHTDYLSSHYRTREKAVDFIWNNFYAVDILKHPVAIKAFLYSFGLRFVPYEKGFMLPNGNAKWRTKMDILDFERYVVQHMVLHKYGFTKRQIKQILTVNFFALKLFENLKVHEQWYTKNFAFEKFKSSYSDLVKQYNRQTGRYQRKSKNVYA